MTDRQPSAQGRVVIDTNVWISAALAPGGPPALVVRRVLADGQPVMCAETFSELSSRLWRPKFDRYLSLEARQAILHDLAAVAHWVELTREVRATRYSRDPDDDKFVQAALVSQASWLVSGDPDLLVLGAVGPLRTATPAEALADPRFLRPAST